METVRETEVQNPAPWHKVFGLDFRSMALFRVFLGLTILADLVYRFPTLVAMYTDEGVMTREVIYRYYQEFVGNNWQYGIWSLHWITGEVSLQYILFGIAALAAVALTIGWKTRIATIISWILLASLHARNPLILTSGDTILKLVLFWSMFLPLGRLWSLDARSRAEATDSVAGKRYFSFASAGLILQIIVMYFFTGVAKCNEDWFSGNAMEYVLRLDIYILPLGRQMLEYPILLTIVTYATLFWEVAGIWLLLSWKSNDFARILVMLSYWAFHIGISLTMAIGLFPFICLVIWLPLVPSSVWQRFGRRKKSDHTVATTVLQDRPGPVRFACSCLAVVVVVFVTLLNIGNINNPTCRLFMPRTIAPLGFWLNLDQRFQMFGRPPKTNPWFVYEATLRDGTQIDLVRSVMEGREVSINHERPEQVLLSLPGHHWRKLHRNLVNPVRKGYRQALADYAVRNWDANHEEDQRVVRMRLVCYTETIGPEYDGIARDSIVWGKYEDPEHSAGSKFDAAVEDILDGVPF